MKKVLIAISIIIIAIPPAFLFLKRNISQKNAMFSANSTNRNNIDDLQSSRAETVRSSKINQSTKQNIPLITNQNIDSLQLPLEYTAKRATKKPFGIFITPQNSPIQPEKFRGYHTGVDLEIFSEENSTDVPIRAICNGTIALKEYIPGYGGVLIQNCEFNNQPITVIYGHLKLASIPKNAGSNLNAGDTIGILGKAYSQETDGERKHLHLGIHKGRSVNVRGYVSTQSELSDWIDPCLYVCK